MLPLAAAVVLLAGGSSFLALRDAPVGPTSTWDQLGSFRQEIKGERTIANFDDDFALWELRDGVVGRFRFLYTPLLVPLRKEKHWAPGQATDFDSFTSATLSGFKYVVTSNTAFASQAPPNFRLADRTAQYLLWERNGPTPPRSVLLEAGRPGATLDCTTAEGRALSRRRGIAHVIPEPVVSGPSDWSSDVKGAGDSASQRLQLPPGDWEISLQYVSREPVDGQGGGREREAAGQSRPHGRLLQCGHGAVSGGAPVDRRRERRPSCPAFGRLLGAKGHTRALDSFQNGTLGAVAATRTDRPGRTMPLRRACGRYVDWYRLGA